MAQLFEKLLNLSESPRLTVKDYFKLIQITLSRPTFGSSSVRGLRLSWDLLKVILYRMLYRIDLPYKIDCTQNQFVITTLIIQNRIFILVS